MINRYKTAVITGANGGIGFETARGLARAGYELVLVARTPARAAAAAERLLLTAPQARVVTESADFADLRAVAALAARLARLRPQIELLVNNAGMFSSHRQLNRDGYELTFTVNFLAPYLLTQRLLGVLQATADSHVINVASLAHRFGRLRLDQVIDPPRYSGFAAYAASKLAMVLWSNHLAATAAGPRVNSLHPGFVKTAINAGADGVAGAVLRLLNGLAVSPQRGAETGLWLAVSPQAAALNGSYVSDLRPRQLHGQATDRRLAAQLISAADGWIAAALSPADR
jgi:NAD(P)-dependent dehydrogenase (short-subunit alcohol dehydrogenase family)